MRRLLGMAAPWFVDVVAPDDEAMLRLMRDVHSPLAARHMKVTLGGSTPAGIAVSYSGRLGHGVGVPWSCEGCSAQASEMVGGLAGTIDGLVSQGFVYVPFLSVVPDLRRHGVGTALIVSSIEEAGERPVLMDVPVGNDDAVRLCESLGFSHGDVLDGFALGAPQVMRMVHQPVIVW